MKKSRILGYTLSALAVTWIVSGIVSDPAVSAQLPLLLDEILLSESGNKDTAPAGTAITVDGSGRWLPMRGAANDSARRNAAMEELLEFDTGAALPRFDTNIALSAEDYRDPSTTAPRAWVWVYDGDPLDRGAYKRELGRSRPARGRFRATGSHAMNSAGPSASAESARLRPGRTGSGYVIEILIRTPRYVMDKMKSLYASDNAPYFGLGLVAFFIGLATLMDLMRSARRA